MRDLLEAALLEAKERGAEWEILKAALHHSGAEQTGVRLTGKDLSLTRFANSTIHQNLTRTNHTLQVRAVIGKRIGTASTNNLDGDSAPGGGGCRKTGRPAGGKRGFRVAPGGGSRRRRGQLLLVHGGVFPCRQSR